MPRLFFAEETGDIQFCKRDTRPRAKKLIKKKGLEKVCKLSLGFKTKFSPLELSVKSPI